MKLYTVDAFTAQAFSGNPAAVCPLEKTLPDETMQAIAREMNLSETAFFLPQETGFHLRWFTPKKEVDLCGHATLATAHILWQENFLPCDQPAIFSTLSGQLTAKKQGDWIEMQFPRGETTALATPKSEVLHALGIEQVSFLGEYRPNRYLIELANADLVQQLKPNFNRLSEIGADRIIVTAAGYPPYDFISRYFAPGAGVNEDPVTGSAHCYLTPYWGQKMNKNTFSAYQASARGGELKLQLTPNHVLIRGQAVTILRSEFCLALT
jgi:PhzF family phenazine biosynthesis protein